MAHQLRLVDAHTGNSSVNAAKKGTGNVIAFENFQTLMQITVGTTPEKNTIMDEIFLW